MNLTTHTDDGDPLAGLSLRARKLLKAMYAARAKCRKLQERRASLEDELMNAMAAATQSQIDYYTCLSMDESQAKERARRSAVKEVRP